MEFWKIKILASNFFMDFHLGKFGLKILMKNPWKIQQELYNISQKSRSLSTKHTSKTALNFPEKSN
jgi:hypothetical protein